MRKMIIILAGLAAATAAYWGYTRFSGETVFEPPQTGSASDLELPDTDTASPRARQTYVHGAEHSYYATRDPLTRQVTREFGFSRLINPGTPAARWEVEKPYIVFYEAAYAYRIDADHGLFQVERTGSTVVPQDGRLEGNVTIRFKPRPGSRVDETTILLDDLMFSSERTEFSTDGPVRAVSSQIDLSGRGLVLMLNAQNGQLEYLHILDLKSLRLKKFVETDSPQPDRAAASSASQEMSASSADLTQQPRQSATAAKDAQAADSAQGRLYQCRIEDTVMIHYGDRIIVGPAEQVSIQNILFRSPDSEKSTQQTSADPTSPVKIDSATASAPLNRLSFDPMPADGLSMGSESMNADWDVRRDVVVTCEGGIVLQPMDESPVDSSAAAMAVEMNGTPLRIEQVAPDSPNSTLPLAHCGLLHYDMTADVLKLFKGSVERDILLSGGLSTAGRIVTRGPVIWNRKAQHAQVAGPGVIYTAGASEDLTEDGQIAFAGQMELFFAESAGQLSSPRLAAVNLTGGIDAQIHNQGLLKTSAESAQLSFGPNNELAQATLKGAVRFENANAASAQSDTAVFHFDDRHQLARADLAGDVNLVSDGERLHTQKAFITFAADEAGQIQPVRFETATAASLEAAGASTEQPPARFEAHRIRYDMITGSGRAVGPVRFVFYQQADPNSGLLTEVWPVEITAEGDADFVAGSDRQIETIIFNRNVHGVRTQQFSAYTQTDTFRCDTMIVTLERNAENRMDIRQITLRDGEVYAESQRMHESLKLAHIRLSCEQMVYDRQKERLIATGPGQIEMDNSKAEPVDTRDGIDLRGPSFARIEGFDRIEWDIAARHILAEGQSDMLEVAYIPLVEGQPARLIRAAGGRVEIEFAPASSDGQNRLARLTAKDHVFYEEQGTYLLEGDTLLYDAQREGWLTIEGTENRPCMVNGARVPYIYYNVNTGQLETQLSTIPGAVPLP